MFCLVTDPIDWVLNALRVPATEVIPDSFNAGYDRQNQQSLTS